MTLDDLIDRLYEVYENNDCDGTIPVKLSIGDHECLTFIVDEAFNETGELTVWLQGEPFS